MAIQFEQIVGFGSLIPDGVSGQFTIDFSEKIKRDVPVANSRPTGVLATNGITCNAKDTNGALIPFAFTQHGARVKITFESVPPAVGPSNNPQNIFSVSAAFLFETD